MTHHTVQPTSVGRPVSPGQLAWLETEVADWRAAGVVDDAQAAAIRVRYVAVRKFSLSKLLLSLGGGFVGIGLIWLVSTNLDDMTSLLRFVVVALVWLGFVIAAEVLATRRAHRAGDGTTSSSPVVGAFRLVTALAFGAVVFQAAQSIQVPAYEPSLLGIWGAGALFYAYATGGVAPLLVSITAGTGWYVWELLEDSQDGMGFVLPVLLAAVIAGAVAAVHAGSRLRNFAPSWREASAVLVLLALFVAAFPYVDVDGFAWSPQIVLGVAVAVAAVVAAAVLSRGRNRLEVLAPLAALIAGVLLVVWESPEPVSGSVSAEGYAHALVSVAVYVVAAGWYAALGVMRDSGRLTFTAMAALVLFTTAQSFAVFAPIVTGAALFLVLGVIFLGSGYLFDRGRRHLVANLEGASA